MRLKMARDMTAAEREQMEKETRELHAAFSVFELACDECSGFGEVYGMPCQICGATGWKPEPEQAQRCR
jgi:DnaJ-class molecular chaperone